MIIEDYLIFPGNSYPSINKYNKNYKIRKYLTLLFCIFTDE
jgi:hypothetical protein